MPKRAYSKGSRKVLAAMKKRYGAKRGTSIFYAKANKFGARGLSRRAKANSIYSKGRHTIRSRRKKR